MKSSLHTWARSWIMLLLVVLVALPVFPASAQQKTIDKIVITKLDYENFPEVKVYAILRNGNNEVVPGSDIETGIEVREGGSQVAYQHQQIAVGGEVVFVFDVGGSLGFGVGTPQDRLNTMKEVAKKHITSMSESDSVGIILVTPAGVQTVQPLTTDAKLAFNNVDKLALPNFETTARSSGLSGISEAIKLLLASTARNTLVQSVVFLSSGVQNNTGTATPVKLAQDNGIFIHGVLVRKDLNADIVSQIARETGGTYANYAESPNSIDAVYEWLSAQREQTVFTFRSVSNSQSTRKVQIQTKTNFGQVLDSQDYTVKLTAPSVEITSPGPNTEIKRQAARYDSNLDATEPTSQAISVRVAYPDGFSNRAVQQVQLVIDGKKVGTALDYPGKEFTLNWDLTPYRASAAVKVQVYVKDELGFESLSAPVDINILVVIPPTPTPIPIREDGVIAVDLCVDMTGQEQIICRVRQFFSNTSNVVSVASLLVAVAAVVFGLTNRRVREAGVQAAGAIRETLVRLTRPGNLEPGAFLEVVRGDETLMGKQIPLYARTVTPAGRSPQEAELVFDMANERSVVSRRHCEFRDENGQFKLRDLGSTHGTYVNGIRLPEGGDGQVLEEGDRIEIGPAERGGVLLIFHVSDTFHSPSANDGEPDTPFEGEDAESVYNTNPAWEE